MWVYLTVVAWKFELREIRNNSWQSPLSQLSCEASIVACCRSTMHGPLKRYMHALYNHSTKKPVTTMLTYPWKCTVLHCNHLGNTWKPLVLMTRHFDYCPSASEGDNHSVRSSAPVVSRCFPGGYNVKLYISRGRLAWWLLAFFAQWTPRKCIEKEQSNLCSRKLAWQMNKRWRPGEMMDSYFISRRQRILSKLTACCEIWNGDILLCFLNAHLVVRRCNFSFHIDWEIMTFAVCGQGSFGVIYWLCKNTHTRLGKESTHDLMCSWSVTFYYIFYQRQQLNLVLSGSMNHIFGDAFYSFEIIEHFSNFTNATAFSCTNYRKLFISKISVAPNDQSDEGFVQTTS